LKRPTSPSFSSPFLAFLFLLPLPAKIMRAFSALSAVLLSVATVLAATVTDPAQDTTWDASKNGQPVAWNAVATDPSSVSIALNNMVSLGCIPA
jgi:hypothetical protein